MDKVAVNVSLKPGVAPPPSYYRDNCTLAFEFVSRQYRGILPQFILDQIGDDATSESNDHDIESRDRRFMLADLFLETIFPLLLLVNMFLVVPPMVFWRVPFQT